MRPTLADLTGSPDWYLHAFQGAEAVFVPMDRAAYRRSIFLDHRISPAGDEAIRVPIAALLDGELPAPQPIEWIFHVAHCGSTLLARAVEALDPMRLVLREPLALRQVALDRDPARLRLVRALLARRYPGDGATLVKANVPVNFILPELTAPVRPEPAILLGLEPADYCLAILRDAPHRAWLHGVTGLLAQHLAPFDPARDGERAAALWVAQMQRFAATAEQSPVARMLDGERFLADPAAMLATAVAHFSISAPTAAVRALVQGPLFATYSKQPGRAFDTAARVEAREHARSGLREEIAEALAWLENHPAELAAIAEAQRGAL